jgi:hypothetical protein
MKVIKIYTKAVIALMLLSPLVSIGLALQGLNFSEALAWSLAFINFIAFIHLAMQEDKKENESPARKSS